MKTCRSFKFATEFGNLFKLERKRAEIGKIFDYSKIWNGLCSKTSFKW